MFHRAKCWHGGQDDALIRVEQRQCRLILCLGTNLAYQLAWLLKIFSSDYVNHQVLVIVLGELHLLWGGEKTWGWTKWPWIGSPEGGGASGVVIIFWILKRKKTEQKKKPRAKYSALLFPLVQTRIGPPLSEQGLAPRGRPAFWFLRWISQPRPESAEGFHAGPHPVRLDWLGLLMQVIIHPLLP